MKRRRGASGSGGRGPRTRERLEVGRQIRDRRMNRVGTIVDFACQYAHPKADPVYSYLIRWDDGQVQALSEIALDRSHGLELVGD